MILNFLNGKRYIGSAVDLKGRQQDHFRKLKKGIHRNSHLQNAFNKYGENTFGWIVLEYIENLEALLSREDIYLRIFWPSGLLYNVCPTAGSTLGYKFTEEQCQAILKRWADKGYRQGMSGKHHTAESRRKSSESHKKWWADKGHRQMMLDLNPILKGLKGERNPMYGRSGEQSPRYGKHHTAESKHEISVARKKYWADRKQQSDNKFGDQETE